MAKLHRIKVGHHPEGWVMMVRPATGRFKGQRFWKLEDGRMVDRDMNLILPTTHPGEWDAFMPNARFVRVL